MTTRSTRVAGLDVRVEGSGAPILLVHGSHGDLDSYAGVVAELVDEFEVWTFTRRGYDAGPAPSTFAAEVADVRALLDAIHRPAHVVGASLGATLLLHAARTDPSGMRSLALFEPPLFLLGTHLPGVRQRYADLVAAGEYHDASLMVAREVTQLPDDLLVLFESAPTLEPAAATCDAQGLLGDLTQMAADTTDAERWSTITLPTILMQGADTWSPIPEGMAALADALPHAERAIWPGQTHFATTTAPDLVARTVADFARRQQ